MSEHAVRLLYGTKEYPVTLPDSCVVEEIHKHRSSPLPDATAAVREALQFPVGLPPLSQWARRGGRVCILVCDITRPAPNGVVLPQLLDELESAGLAADDVTILIATGLHRPAPEDEKRLIVGDDHVRGSVRVVNHYANRDDQHKRLGTTSRGTPVLIDKRFAEAELKVVISLVEPHFMAGYSGGRKLIAPGVAHRETILAFHSPGFMEHPSACNCVLRGNPLHEDQLEIAKMIGAIFGVNMVINEHREPVFVNAGDLISSHLQAVAFARGICEVGVSRKFSTILTSAGGFPLDKTYYQTVKGMVAPLDILAPGGRVVILSECSEGMGSANFLEAQRWLVGSGRRGFLKKIGEKDHVPLIDQWQTEKLVEALERGQVVLFSENLEENDWLLTGVHRTHDPANAVLDGIQQSRDPHVAVISEGPYVIPLYKP
jgi:nickel-dependent lactate racemase